MNAPHEAADREKAKADKAAKDAEAKEAKEAKWMNDFSDL